MMKNTKKIARIIALALAVFMFAAVLLYIAPVAFAEENGQEVTTEKKEEEEKKAEEAKKKKEAEEAKKKAEEAAKKAAEEAEKKRLEEEAKKKKEVEDAKKKEEEEYRRYLNEMQYLGDQYVKQIATMIEQFKNTPGYVGAVKKLQDFLSSINPRAGVDPNAAKAVIDGFNKDEIELKKNPILMGDENGNFNANNTLTRAEFAVVLARLNKISLDGISWFDAAMKFAKESGYMKGDDEGNMMPEKPISIAEVVSVFVRYKEFTTLEGNTLSLPAAHWAIPAMQRAYVDGWLTGINDPQNCDRAITRGELASMLTKVRQIKIDRAQINEEIVLYKRFPDVDINNPYYYDIIVNAN